MSPAGNDTNDGTAAAPWQTLNGAQQAIRKHLQSSSVVEPTTIWIHGGEYNLNTCWTFGPEDSGSPDAPVVWRAVPDQTVIISGAVLQQNTVTIPSGLLAQIPSDARTSVTGWTVSRELMGQNSAQWPEETFGKICAGNEFLTPARSPNEGWAHGTWLHGNQLQSESVTLPQENSETVWLHGFFTAPWDDMRLKFSQSHNSTISPLNLPESLLTDASFRGVHALHYLDQHGEWFYDNAQQILIAWIPSGTSPSITQSETLVALYAAHDLEFRGLTFQQAKHMGIEIARCRNVRLDDSTVRGIADTGIHVFGGTNNRITSCKIEHTGRHAIRVEAGDRASLKPCQHMVENCWIKDFGRSRIGFSAAVYLAGVGATIKNCRISEGSDAAIRIDGNDHQVLLNEIHKVCQDSIDTGAIYLGHDWTERGNTIRHNFICDIGGRGKLDVMGIYLDDFASGTIVEENIIRNAGRAIAIGGGRDNQLRGNVIVDCEVGIQVDSRGETWATDRVHGDASSLTELLRNLGESRSVYYERYPELQACESVTANRAAGNQLANNVLIASGGIALDDQLLSGDVLLTNNLKHPGTPSDNAVWWPESLANDPTVRSVIAGVDAWMEIGPRSNQSQLTSMSDEFDVTTRDNDSLETTFTKSE